MRELWGFEDNNQSASLNIAMYRYLFESNPITRGNLINVLLEANEISSLYNAINLSNMFS
jgi:hypothetical protein